MFQFVSKCARQLGFLFLLIASFNPAFSQESSVASLGTSEDGSRAAIHRSEPSSPREPASVLARFVAAETKVREALNRHMFKRDVVLQTIGPNGEITGEYIRNSQFVFDDRGRRVERVLFHPGSTIREMRITKEDIQDLAGSQLLGIDIVEASKYHLSYVGAETVDSRQLIAVDVTPVTQPDPGHMSDRFFVGRVWIDPTNFQIVKIKGIVEPQGKQRFPAFETWREPVKDALAFPARTEADDILHFRNCDVHYRIKVRYYDYKMFASKVTITELDEPPPQMSEAPPKLNGAPQKVDQAAPSKSEAPPKTKAAPPKTSEVPPNQLPLPQISPPNIAEACATNRSAPPVGPYHWPADTAVSLYFIRNMFTPEQRSTLIEAMKTWTMADLENGSGVRFIEAGETDVRMSCRSCLTVGRRDVYKQDKHHYAFFHPMSQEGRLLVSAWIDLDFGIISPKALQGFMVHELAHGLGLWDCTTCKKKLTIMNSFPGINKNNGLVTPSRCDLATVKDVYQEERQVASATFHGVQRPEPTQAVSPLALAPLGLEKASFSVLDIQRPLVGAAEAAKSSADKRPETFPVDSVFALPPLGLVKGNSSVTGVQRPLMGRAGEVNSSDHQRPETVRTDRTFAPPLGLEKQSFSLFPLQRHHVDRSLFFWGGTF